MSRCMLLAALLFMPFWTPCSTWTTPCQSATFERMVSLFRNESRQVTAAQVARARRDPFVVGLRNWPLVNEVYR